jgi:hypothetical protein
MTQANGKEESGTASLIRKRFQIVSQIGEREIELQNLVLQLGHIDAALRILKPEIALTALPEKPAIIRNPRRRGEVSRPILATLHAATGPLTVKDIARAVLLARGKPALRIREDDRKGVRRILCYLQKQGAVRAVGMVGPAQTWELVRD